MMLENELVKACETLPFPKTHGTLQEEMAECLNAGMTVTFETMLWTDDLRVDVIARFKYCNLRYSFSTTFGMLREWSRSVGFDDYLASVVASGREKILKEAGKENKL